MAPNKVTLFLVEMDPDVILRKHLAAFGTWPQEERKAVQTDLIEHQRSKAYNGRKFPIAR
jgi:hypothetical protein